MRAAVYVRVSTQEQAREGISLAAQEEACRRMAVEEQVIFLGAVFRQVEVFRGRIVLHYQGDVLPPQERSTGFRYAPRLGMADVGF